MRFFNNSIWGKVFVDQHNENKNWAINNSKFNQPTAMNDVDNIAAFFKSLKDKIDSEFLI